MSEPLTLAFAGAVGTLIGVVFFGGLLWTVRKGVSSKQPALWFVCSLLLRTAVALTGFYLVSDRHADRLLSCLMGFGAASLGVMWVTRLSARIRPAAIREVPRASDSR